MRRGREIGLRQRQLVAEIRARGLNSKTEESLVAAFERALALFERDLEAIRKDKRGARSPPAGS